MKSAKTIEKIRAEVIAIQIGMFSTIYQGEIQSRPMALQDMDDENSLWFFTHQNDEHNKLDEIKENPLVQVNMVDSDEQLYYSFNGKAAIVSDSAMIDKYWSLVAKAWFPQGKEDPGLVLIKVSPHRCEWWDSHSSMVKMGYEIAKALVTETQYNSGAHQVVNL